MSVRVIRGDATEPTTETCRTTCTTARGGRMTCTTSCSTTRDVTVESSPTRGRGSPDVADDFTSSDNLFQFNPNKIGVHVLASSMPIGHIAGYTVRLRVSSTVPG